MILRTVNLYVARGAVLESYSRLVVKARRVRRADFVGVAVAFQTELAHVVALEQLRISGPVRRVADRAAFDLQRRMLEDERPLLVRMALDAGLIVPGG